jgi:hypothetical protein
MDPAQRRRGIQLGVLGAVLLVVVWFVLLPALRSPVIPAGPVATPATAGANSRAGAAAAARRPIDVRLDALDRTAQAEDPEAPRRNPFRMGAAAPPEGSSSAGATGPRLPPKPVTPVVQVPITPPGPPPPPPIPYKFIGVLTGAPGKGRIAVLTDGRTVVHGQVNTEIEGRYRIVQIGEESLQIEYLDGRGRQTIRLLGQ